MSMNWKNGDFDRTKISSIFHPFTPAHATDCLEDVNLEHLWARGKRLILLDVDNTLVEWKQENFSESVIAWLDKAKAIGFDLCILSNTRRVERLTRISQRLGIDTVRGRFKPSRKMYRMALIRYKRKPQEAIMLGDQMMTDILGANRAGIDAIWVRQMAHKEFGPTKINRFIEGFLKSAIYTALITPMDETPASPEEEAQKPPAERTIVHQIIRFGIVGATAFVVDLAIRTFLIRLSIGGFSPSHALGHWLRTASDFFTTRFSDDQRASAPILFGIASLVAMTVSFFLNRSFTFEVRGKEERLKQAKRFYAVSLVGYVINLTISSLVYNSSKSIPLSSVCGAAVAAVWNFLGSRYFAFKK